MWRAKGLERHAVDTACVYPNTMAQQPAGLLAHSSKCAQFSSFCFSAVFADSSLCHCGLRHCVIKHFSVVLTSLQDQPPAQRVRARLCARAHVGLPTRCARIDTHAMPLASALDDDTDRVLMICVGGPLKTFVDTHVG